MTRAKNHQVILGLTLAAFGLGGCFLVSKVEPTARALKEGGANAFNEGTFIIERSADETSANIRFETKTTYSCQITFYPKESNPTVASLSWTACTSPQPGRIFSETVSGLDPAKLYTVAVRLWPLGSTAEQGSIYRVSEDASPGDPNTTLVLRTDARAFGGTVEAIKLSDTRAATLAKILAPKACALVSALDQTPSYGENQNTLPFTRLATRGYMIGATEVALDSSGVKTYTASSVVGTATDWVLNVQTSTTSGSVRFKRPTFLKESKLTQGSVSATLTEPTLDDNEYPATSVSAASDLNVQWTLDGPADQTMIVITAVSHVGGENGVCIYAAKDGSANIPKEFLAKFSKGRGFITIRAETVQTVDSKRWIVRSSDWRTQTVLW